MSHNTRLTTGIQGLDGLLTGGLLPERVVLIKGEPGTGKTTLGVQMMLAPLAAGADCSSVILSFEQNERQLAQDLEGFGWDIEDLIRRKRLHLIYISPEEMLEKPGRNANRLIMTLEDLADEHGAQRVLIDSISYLVPVLGTTDLRAAFLRFINALKEIGLTPVLTADVIEGAGLAGIDAYLVDTLIKVYRTSQGTHERRHIEVVKSRGSAHVGGLHPMSIEASGVRVYPRLNGASQAATTDDQPAAALPTGVRGLDELLGGGYAPGSVVLAAGLSGTCKTQLAGHFTGGADKAVWLSFQEGPAELSAVSAGAGNTLGAMLTGGGLRVVQARAGELSVEELMAQVEEAIEQTGATHAVVDGLSELAQAHEGPQEKFEAMSWALGRLRARRVTTLATERLDRVTGRTPISEIQCAALADTIVYLGLVEIESRLEKIISVLKHRGGAAAGDLRHLCFDAKGLRVAERFVGLSGVLEGSPLGQRKTQIEEIFQPLYFIRDFLQMAQDPGTDQTQRAAVLANLSGETERLIAMLGHYFDQPAAGKGKTS